MLDFTAKPPDVRKARCDSRAALARRSARGVMVVLAGLVGIALISDPSLVGTARTGLDAMLSHSHSVMRLADADPQGLPATHPVATLPLTDGTVARADTGALRP